MIDLATVWVFLLAVLALFLSPGPNMAFVLSHGVAHGPQGGCAAALGITVADLVLTLLTASGVTALVAAWPQSFDLLRYGGALYLVWLALATLRTRTGLVLGRAAPVPLPRIFRMAFFNSLLNPKALLFFMVFLPQFVLPERGPVALQLALLGCILSFELLLLNAVLGSISGRVGTLLARSARIAGFQRWFLGGMLLALAARLLLLERPLGR